MTSRSNTVTSASNPWASARAGQIFSVKGGAASGLQLITTVAVVNSAGSLTLRASNASGGNISGKGCIWGTDDTPAWNAAVAHGGTIVANGNYLLKSVGTGSRSSLSSSETVLIPGNTTILQKAGIVYLVGASGANNGGDDGVIWFTVNDHTHNIVLDGLHLYGENYPFSSYTTFALNPNLSTVAWFGAKPLGPGTIDTNNVVFRNFYMENIVGYGPATNGCTKCDIYDGSIVNIGNELNLNAKDSRTSGIHFVNARLESGGSGNQYYDLDFTGDTNLTSFPFEMQLGGYTGPNGPTPACQITVNNIRMASVGVGGGLSLANCIQNSTISNVTIQGISSGKIGIVSAFTPTGVYTGNNVFSAISLTSDGTGGVGILDTANLDGSNTGHNTYIGVHESGAFLQGAAIGSNGNHFSGNTWTGVAGDVAVNAGKGQIFAGDFLAHGSWALSSGGTIAGADFFLPDGTKIQFGATLFTLSGTAADTPTSISANRGTFITRITGLTQVGITFPEPAAIGSGFPVNGWICTAFDQTHPAVSVVQIANNHSSCTVQSQASTTTGDVIGFAAVPF